MLITGGGGDKSEEARLRDPKPKNEEGMLGLEVRNLRAPTCSCFR